MGFAGDGGISWSVVRAARLRGGRTLAVGPTLLLAACLAVPAAAQQQVLVEAGSPITYLANDSDPGVEMVWTDPSFADSGWDVGIYGVGYETAGGAENLLQTLVPAGTISIYTRAVFTVPSVDAIDNLWFGSDHDDGIVAWINGTEVYRSEEMPSAGPLDWNTPPISSESSNGPSPVYSPYHDLSAAGIGALQDGENLLAVAVWNTSGSSSDLVLVPQLVANKGLQLTRGPYLQIGTPSSVRIRWRTDIYEDSEVLYGPDPQNLVSSVVDPAAVLDHDVALTGLQPETRYYYAIGNTGETLAGADLEHYFETAPTPGLPKTTRIWVLGDSGFVGLPQQTVRDSYYTFSSDRHTDLWLHVGDISQAVGTDAQYQEEFFDVFPEMMRQTVLWPTLGNHDGYSANSDFGWGPYYENFSLPADGEAGGVPSGTEAYYSFDFAHMHFVVLNSYDVDRSPDGDMLTWLEADLADSDKDWIIAYFHHPAYSKGHHDSDDPLDSGGRLRDMRENALPILEDYGVDLVMAGHSHCYERSFLLDGHYDTSDTLAPAMRVDDGDGREDGDGAYLKPLRSQAPHAGPGDGAVYMTTGSGSEAWGGSLDHPVMVVSLNLVGSMVLDVDGLRLDGTFLDNTCTVPPCASSVLDHFTLIRGANCQESDLDKDGECDDDDNCPDDYNPHQEDEDGDGPGDVCDPCPADPDDDADSDGHCADEDNCPDDPNPNQEDADSDGVGDLCDVCPNDPDDDADGDSHCADDDNCPDDANPNQEDRDTDGIGDTCDGCPDDADNDLDGDGVCGDVDNCPAVPNGDQADADADTAGNLCDPCPLDAEDDADGDTFCSNADNCPDVANDQHDADSDGIGDACDACPLDADNDFDQDGWCGNADNCPGAPNPGQEDGNENGIGDACEFANDSDGDSVPDGIDNCQTVSNPAQQDTDGDGQGDACDDDDDGDGVLDGADCAPLSRGVSALPGPVGVTLFLEKSPDTTLRWRRALQGPVSHVYRTIGIADEGYPGSLECADFGITGTASVQADVPLEGEIFFFVVGAANICDPGDLGEGRAATVECPIDGADYDQDGVQDLADNCARTFNPDLSDVDADFVGDVCDNCPTISNPGQTDSDGDLEGDACDGDASLVGHWTFNEGTDLTAGDSSGFGNDGVLLNGAGWGAGLTGDPADFAVALDGIDDYVDVGSGPSLDDLAALTYAAWVYPTASGERELLSKLNSTHELRLTKIGALRGCIIASGGNACSESVLEAVPLNAWTHVAMTYDDSGDRQVHLYVDGVEVTYFARSTAGGTLASDAVAAQLIGRRGNGIRPFEGFLDEIRIYAAVLDLCRIEELAGVPGVPAAHTVFVTNGDYTGAFCRKPTR